jgi:guanylate kinase
MVEKQAKTSTAGPGVLVIISGPSGGGKSSLVERLFQSTPLPLSYSVSATTRVARAGEIDGKHYHFMPRAQFEALRDQGAFLEYAEVYGNLYGTPKAPVLDMLRQGRWVVLEIDVQGAKQVKESLPDAVTVFVRAPSLETYEQRIRARGTESSEAISRRLAVCQAELAAAWSFDFQVVNDDLEQAARTVQTLLCGVRYLREKADVR